MNLPAPKPACRPLLRMIALARPRTTPFVLGVLLGALATGAGVGLLSVSAWLLATAATHPPITALGVAVVATRALGVTRGVARYWERLDTHDAAFRTLAEVRVRVYERLARSAVRRFSGDLVRLVNTAPQDAGAASPAVCPPSVRSRPGTVLPCLRLLLAGLPRRWRCRCSRPRWSARRGAPVSSAGESALVDTDGARTAAYGVMEQAVRRVERADAELTRLARRDAAVLGLGTGASALVAGLTVWATLLLGVAAVAGGTLDAIAFAVVVLTALAAFEIVAPLPAVAAKLEAIRTAGARLFDVLDTEPEVKAAAAPEQSGLPDQAATLRVRDLRVRYGPDEPWALDGVDLDLAPGKRIAVLGPSGSGKSTLASVLFRFRDPDAGTVTLDGADITDYPVDEVRRLISGVPQDRTFSRARCARPAVGPARRGRCGTVGGP